MSATSDRDEVVQCLTIVPDTWSISKTAEVFNVTPYAVRQARELKAKKGILATPGKQSREGISEVTKNSVIRFYENEEVSRLRPGMKDCVSIKMPDGTKEKVQKRLLLANILEIYTLFKSEHPDVKIGFSSFALLRPKWCIPVGAAGMHNVCVCTYHQNVKLMLSTVDRSLDYKEVLKLCVCDVSNPDCMLNHCDSCPRESVIKLFLVDKLVMKYSRDSTIKFSQWISTDRSQLEENECDFDEFIEKLTTMFYKLTEHHYIAKSQSAYFKHRNASLTSDECVIVLDFAENYAFIVQDAAQPFHWNNSQATIHHFVMYYQDRHWFHSSQNLCLYK